MAHLWFTPQSFVGWDERFVIECIIYGSDYTKLLSQVQLTTFIIISESQKNNILLIYNYNPNRLTNNYTRTTFTKYFALSMLSEYEISKKKLRAREEVISKFHLCFFFQLSTKPPFIVNSQKRKQFEKIQIWTIIDNDLENKKVFVWIRSIIDYKLFVID